MSKEATNVSPQAATDPLISVVVTCRNQRELAVAMLRALNAQREHYPQSEVILVDQGSLDHTRQMVMSGFPGVRVISAPEGLSGVKASSLGTVLASGVVIAVIDCTADIEPGLFRRLADAYLSAVSLAPQRLILSLPVVQSAIVQQPAA